MSRKLQSEEGTDPGLKGLVSTFVWGREITAYSM